MKPFDECMSPMERELGHHQMHLKEMRELDDFKKCITEIVENYLKMIDTKMSFQDLEIQRGVLNIPQIVTELFNEGKITVNATYDPETESLTFGGAVNG